MFKNYFYLNRIINELDGEVKGAVIKGAFTQEKERLYFNIANSTFAARHIVVSTDWNLPFINIKEEHYRAKKNTFDFFGEFFPDKILRLSLVKEDRIIRIELQNSSIYIFFTGGNANILLCKGNEISFFKKPKQKLEITTEKLKELEFTERLYYPSLGKLSSNRFNENELRKYYPFVNKHIRGEYRVRFNIEEENFRENVKAVIDAIYYDNPVVYFDESENKVLLRPKSFKVFNSFSNYKEYENLSSALNGFLVANYRFVNIHSKKEAIKKHLQKELERTSSKLNKLKNRIEEGSKENDYRTIGELLLGNFHLIKKGMESLTVLDYGSGKEVKVSLDSKKFPRENVDYYFDKGKNERINFQKSTELYKLTLQKYEDLLKAKKEAEKSEDARDLIGLSKKLKVRNMDKKEHRAEDKIKFKKYIISGKYPLYVGKDSKSNDLLTVKFAKQNDYWFHARGLPGSHVVLRIENTKEAVPKNILKEAASIAAFHSKAKTAKVAPVSYTFAKFVYKKKGMAPGKVMLSKESVLLVKPEIPTNAEFVEE